MRTKYYVFVCGLYMQEVSKTEFKKCINYMDSVYGVCRSEIPTTKRVIYGTIINDIYLQVACIERS